MSCEYNIRQNHYNRNPFLLTISDQDFWYNYQGFMWKKEIHRVKNQVIEQKGYQLYDYMNHLKIEFLKQKNSNIAEKMMIFDEDLEGVYYVDQDEKLVRRFNPLKLLMRDSDDSSFEGLVAINDNHSFQIVNKRTIQSLKMV